MADCTFLWHGWTWRGGGGECVRGAGWGTGGCGWDARVEWFDRCVDGWVMGWMVVVGSTQCTTSSPVSPRQKSDHVSGG